MRHFQQERGISVDGIVGRGTWRLLEESRWRLGDRILSHDPGHPLTGDDVSALQQRLSDLGFDIGRVDGIFGLRTAGAVREFQRNTGLVPDGTCGPMTYAALTRLGRTVRGGAPHALRESEILHRSGPAMPGKVVVLDPGHGGADHGNSGHGLTEAEINSDLAARIEGRLVAVGVLTYPTHGLLDDADVPPSDADRAAFANAAGADLLISVHCDGIAEETPGHDLPHGVATYFYGLAPGADGRPTGPHSAVGERLAQLVQSEIVARTDLLDCGTHAKTWELLRWTTMPAVHVEVGYLSHPGDAARLAEPAFRDTVAEAVAVAVQRLYLVDDDAGTGLLRLPELTSS